MTRPSSKTSQLQPAVVSLATSPPSVLSLQVLLLNNLTKQVLTVNSAKLSSPRIPHILLFQLEGAYGRACSVREGRRVEAEEKLHLEEEEERVTNLNINLNAISLGGSREDTVSPMASQRTGEKTN